MTEEKKKPVKMEDVRAKADETSCPVRKSLVFIEEFLAEPMCGRCFPCSMGTYETRIRLKRLIAGTGSETDIGTVREIAAHMQSASMCKKGKDTSAYMLEQIDKKEFKDHLSGVCSDNECPAFITYMIIPENCTMCGNCLDVCRDNAIMGEKIKPYLSGYMPFEIAQKRCTKCGECVKVCRDNAIRTLTAKELAEEEPVGT